MRCHWSVQDWVAESPELKALQWNGREIRNGTSTATSRPGFVLDALTSRVMAAFQTAVALAVHASKVHDEQHPEERPATPTIRADHLKQVVKMSSAFKTYMEKTRRMSEYDRAFKLGIRDDGALDGGAGMPRRGQLGARRGN